MRLKWLGIASVSFDYMKCIGYIKRNATTTTTEIGPVVIVKAEKEEEVEGAKQFPCQFGPG